MVISIPFHLLSSTFEGYRFHVFHADLWLFVWSKPLQQGGFSVHHLLSRVQNVGKIEIAIGNLVRFCDAVIKEYHK